MQDLLTLRAYLKQDMAEREHRHREVGDRRIPSDLRQHYARQATEHWWRALEDAVWEGRDIPHRIWASARASHPYRCTRLRGIWLNRRPATV